MHLQPMEPKNGMVWSMDPFYNGDAQNTGLDLSIPYRIAQWKRGINVFPQFGKTFFFFFLHETCLDL